MSNLRGAGQSCFSGAADQGREEIRAVLLGTEKKPEQGIQAPRYGAHAQFRPSSLLSCAEDHIWVLPSYCSLPSLPPGLYVSAWGALPCLLGSLILLALPSHLNTQQKSKSRKSLLCGKVRALVSNSLGAQGLNTVVYQDSRQTREA